jgi:hypothetical protein
VSSERGAVATATEALGLLAGIVAALYVLGGAVLALRLVFDEFPIEAVVALIGQLPRELLIAVGLIEAVAPAALVGLCAALLYGAFGRPRRDPTASADLDKGRRWGLVFVGLAVLALALNASGVVTAILTDGVGLLLLTSILGWAVTFALVIAGWYVLRRIGQTSWSRLARALAAGGIWTAMALVGGVTLAAAVPFERASVCVKGSRAPLTGNLIADTKDRVILGVSQRPRRVVSIPASTVARVRYGNLPKDLPCE